VALDQFHGPGITQPLFQFGRANDVGKEQRQNAGAVAAAKVFNSLPLSIRQLRFGGHDRVSLPVVSEPAMNCHQRA